MTCYGAGDERRPAGTPGYLPRQDVWRVEVAGQASPLLHAGATVFHLAHVGTGALLQATGRPLPAAWGRGRGEVASNRHTRDAASGWVVDNHVNPGVSRFKWTACLGRPVCSPRPFEAALPVHGAPGDWLVAPSFWAKLLELHREMVHANGRLVVAHPYASRPLAWPLLDRGVSFWQGAGAEAVRGYVSFCVPPCRPRLTGPGAGARGRASKCTCWATRWFGPPAPRRSCSLWRWISCTCCASAAPAWTSLPRTWPGGLAPPCAVVWVTLVACP